MRIAWSADGSSIYYAVTQPLTKEQEEAEKTEWKDVIRWREQHRGDVLLKQALRRRWGGRWPWRRRRRRLTAKTETKRRTKAPRLAGGG